MKKSDSYYLVRSIVRGMVQMFIILSVLVIIHMAAYNIWTALTFSSIVLGGVWFLSSKEQTAIKVANEESELLQTV